MEPKYAMVRENSVCDGATATCSCGIDSGDCKCGDCGTCARMEIREIRPDEIVINGYVQRCPRGVRHSHDGRTLCGSS